MASKKIALFLIVFLIPLIIAQGVEVDYSGEVSLEEEFSFKIKLVDFGVDTYDVKIDILFNGNRIAKILNNEEWKSTYYYVNDIINENEEKEFFLKIIEDFDEAEVIIKIRDSVNKVETFTGYSIKKSSSDSGETNQSSGSEEEQEEDNGEEDTEPEIIHISQNNTQGKKNNQILKTINLNTEKNNQRLNKSDYALYGLIVFAAFIIILLLLRKNKNKNEFK
jgi:hypothetical protein